MKITLHIIRESFGEEVIKAQIRADRSEGVLETPFLPRNWQLRQTGFILWKRSIFPVFRLYVIKEHSSFWEEKKRNI